MASKDVLLPKVFRDDVIRNKATGELAVILRSYNDSDEIPIPTHLQRDPSMRPLKRGELSIMMLADATRSIIDEDSYELVERYFHLGDTVRGSGAMTGVIQAHRTEVQLRHVITDDKPLSSDWISEGDVVSAYSVNPGDLVLYKDWVGHVEEVFEDVIGQTRGEWVRFQDMGGGYRLGRASWDRSLRPEGFTPDIVFAIRPVAFCIGWVAINQTLSPEETASRPRPSSYWMSSDAADLTFFRRTSEQIRHVMDRVDFRSEVLRQKHGASPSTHETSNIGESEPVTVKAMTVAATRTEVTILWQNGMSEVASSSSFIPYHNLDDLDCWPGDFVMWKGDGETRTAVIQTLNPAERTARVRWVPRRESEPEFATVSALELDPKGSVESENVEVFGLQRGDIVLIHPEGKTNGAVVPNIPRIGEMEAWLRDPHMTGWHQEFGRMAATNATNGVRPSKVGQNPDLSLKWIAEVSDLTLSGEAIVKYVDGSVETLPLDRFSILNDFLDDMMQSEEGDEEGDGDGMDIEMDGVPPFGPFGNALGLGSIAPFGFFGGSIPHDPLQPTPIFPDAPMEEDEHDAWQHLDEEEEESPSPTSSSDAVDIIVDSNETDTSPRSILVTPPRLTSANPAHSSQLSTPSSSSPSSQLVPPLSRAETSTPVSLSSGAIASSAWTPFAILPTAPEDHAFFSEIPPSQSSKQFMQRLNKEYRVLSSSLPAEGILVRAYENRTDLLRSLIIGSENTPYEDCPFVVDWLLPPNFPNEPPKAHFHSWTNGNGRVNPNLYEDGKVCLSILNTWEGERNEAWSAARSSILQALVSIQALVLVKEPYFCEPSFERMRGTEEGTLNSRMYSERVYVLSRGFVRHALNNSPASLEEEMRWLYLTKGKLRKVVNDGQDLIAYSKSSSTTDAPPTNGDRSDRAIERLTLGGILPLERILAQLYSILIS